MCLLLEEKGQRYIKRCNLPWVKTALLEVTVLACCDVRPSLDVQSAVLYTAAPLQPSPRKRQLIVRGDRTVDVLLKVLEKSVPPHPRERVTLRRLLQRLLVGHRVVPPEETCSDKICHHHIHSVVVMGQEDAENSHSA